MSSQYHKKRNRDTWFDPKVAKGLQPNRLVDSLIETLILLQIIVKYTEYEQTRFNAKQDTDLPLGKNTIRYGMGSSLRHRWKRLRGYAYSSR